MTTFNPKILDFLKLLVVNNQREWFHDHKDLYTEAKSLFEDFVSEQIKAIAQFDPQVKDLQAKDCTFRIYRDIRFSQDKTPYKIYFGAYMAQGGRKSPYAGYYTHIEPDNSIIAGGLHSPEKNTLDKVRAHIFENMAEFKALIDNPEFKKQFPKIYGEQLKTAPKGYDKNFEHIELLRYKSYDFLKPISDQTLLKPDFLENTLKDFKTLFPLNQFLNAVMN